MKGLVILLLIVAPSLVFGQKKTANVLSYYAVTNSIDGQPLINKRNLLRFYPVFALRDSITAVKVTIYYGGEIFVANATPFENGLYWEVKLPEFDLGDAIQRYEVETELKYDINIKQQLLNYRRLIEGESQAAILAIKNGIDTFNSNYKSFSSAFDSSVADIGRNNQTANVVFNKLNKIVMFQDSIQNLLTSRNRKDSTQVQNLPAIDAQRKVLMATIDVSKSKTFELNQNVLARYVDIGKTLDKDIVNAKFTSISFATKQQKSIAKYITSQEYLIDSLKSNLIRKLTDKEFSGIGIQQSDILFGKDYKTARILYRNYRIENRTLVALDPAEKLSIFRLRYIPFPIIGSSLEGPSKPGVPIVFEAGITFGNQVITTNEFFNPELSIRRLGVAVAFTPQLFSQDAKILALLFTYDFNAYASLGVGANFGTGVNIDSSSGTQRKPEPYFSFGINQKAFQRLVVGIANIFK